MKAFNKTLLVAALTLVASGSVTAASDGTLGDTSTGSSVVTIIKDDAVQLSNVGDLDLGKFSSVAVDLTASDDVCVFNSTANYKVTVSSANSAFELSNGTESIPYQLTWQDDVAGTASSLSHATAMVGQFGDRSSPNCGGGTNATFEVTVASADFNSAAPGTYVDTLTLMIEPE